MSAIDHDIQKCLFMVARNFFNILKIQIQYKCIKPTCFPSWGGLRLHLSSNTLLVAACASEEEAVRINQVS